MATSLSSHSVKRLKERANVSSKREAKHKAVHARNCGYSPSDFTGDFKNYLLSKCKSGMKIKVHCEFIYIFDGTRLITSYEVPKKYKGKVDSYLTSCKNKEKLMLDSTSKKCKSESVELKVDKTKELSIIRHSLRNQLSRGCDRIEVLNSSLFINSIYGGYYHSELLDKSKNYMNDEAVNCFADYVIKKLEG